MARMMGTPMRSNDFSNAYSHPSPGYSSSHYSRTCSNLSSFSHADEEENVESTPPPRHASRFTPRPPSSPCLNRLSMKKNVNVTTAHIKSEEEGILHRYRIVDAEAFYNNGIMCFVRHNFLFCLKFHILRGKTNYAIIILSF
jgi:hypothetical protein